MMTSRDRLLHQIRGEYYFTTERVIDGKVIDGVGGGGGGGGTTTIRFAVAVEGREKGGWGWE